METFKRFIRRGDVLLGLGIWAVAGLVAIGDHFELNKSEWASWVQAIGSIAAIAGAIWIAGEQARRDHRKAAATEIQTELAAAQVLASLIGQAAIFAIDLEDAATKTNSRVLMNTTKGLDALRVAAEGVMGRATSQEIVEAAMLLHNSMVTGQVVVGQAISSTDSGTWIACATEFKIQRETLTSCDNKIGLLIYDLQGKLSQFS